MYAWIWRHLPGSTGLRAALSVLLVSLVAVVLLFVVFPRVEPLLPLNNVTVDTGRPAR